MTRRKPNRDQEIGKAFVGFVETVRMLRDPKQGCPWDRRQNHKSLRRYMLEEAYEAHRLMGERQPRAGSSRAKELADELGDVLLQVVLNAQVARDDGRFDIADVVRSIDEKMQRRHPHIFAVPAHQRGRRIHERTLRLQWNAIKAAEKAMQERLLPADRGRRSRKAQKEGLMTRAAEAVGPASLRAHKIGEVARRVGFDWPSADAVFKQWCSEITEVRRAWKAPKGVRWRAAVVEELGDVIFTTAHLLRHLGTDLETVSEGANRKFVKRFEQMEALAKSKGQDFRRLEGTEKERLWRQVKRSS